MPDDWSEGPANANTAGRNVYRISREYDDESRPDVRSMLNTTFNLRKELRQKIPEGNFRRGGRVKRTGIYRLHRGEHVVPARHRRRGRR